MAEGRARLLRIIAQEVDRLAHFGDGVGQRLARFAHDQAQQDRHARLHRVGRSVQHRRAFGDRAIGPARFRRADRRCARFLGARFGDAADNIAMVGGVEHGARWAARAFGRSGPADRRAFAQRVAQPREHRFVAQVQPVRIAPVGIEVGRQRDQVVPRAGMRHRRHQIHRIGDHLLDRHGRVGDPVDEAAVRAIFQQAAHQIRQQRLMRAHRRIDAARPVQLLRAHHLLVQRLAHAVQALELIIADREIRPGEMIDAAQRLGVMRGELREDAVARRQQLAGAGDIGDVGMQLARIDGEIGQALDLRALDLGIPIGAFHQPHHDAPIAAPRQIDDPVDDEGAALAIALHHEAQAVPAGKLRIGRQAFQQVERQFQPVGFLGIDVEADVVALGQQRQLLHGRQQFAHHAVRLRADIARVQRRQFDRNARPRIDAPPGRRLADGVDRSLIIGIIAPGVGGRGRRLAQHVIAVGKALGFHLPRALQRFLDGFAGHELLAHHAHRQVDAAPDHRLARARDQPRQRRAQPAIVDAADQLARHHQAPGGGIDEQRLLAAQMRSPVAVGDLVADQRIARGRIGNAQQRLGQAHQRHPFLAGQRIFLHQPLDAAAFAIGAQRGHQRARGAGDGGARRGGQSRRGDQGRKRLRLVAAIGGGDRLTQRRRLANGGGELGERLVGHGRRIIANARSFRLKIGPDQAEVTY